MNRLSVVAPATAFVALSSAFTFSAMAQSRVEVGVLECRGSTTSFIVGSVTDMGCMFRPANGGGTRAISRLRRAGVDLGLNQQIAVVWAVWAPSSGDPRRDLAGNYAGGAPRSALASAPTH